MRSALVALLLCGCGGGATPSHPSTAIQAYLRAVRSNDADAAYALLSSTQQASISKEEFTRAFRENRGELDDQARALSRLGARDMTAVGEVTYGDGESAALVLEPGGWRLSGGVAEAYSLRSPQQALRSLRRALERRSYDALMRILARRSRSQVDDEVRRLVDALHDAENLEVVVDGDRARVEYEPGHVIELQREDGEWRILDLD
jgi:hypothetical protein